MNKDKIQETMCKFEKDKKFMIVSKNNGFTSRETTVNPDDRILLAPPIVSGG
jgi:molybdopterin converting factor small subunit